MLKALAALEAARNTTAGNATAVAQYVPNAQFEIEVRANHSMPTADEFDAWMKSRGVRVVKAPGTPAAAPAPAPAEPAKKN